MPAIRTPNAKQQFFFNDGTPAAGGRLYTYAANTITPQATYTNRAGTVANTNPIILDARGEATMFLTPGVVYDYVLKDDQDVTIWTQEDITADAGDADAVVFIQAGTGAVSRSSQDKTREIDRSITDFGADPTGSVSCNTAFALAQDAVALTGGRVTFPEGRFRFTDSIVLGNAAPSNPSTLNGVGIVGKGVGRTQQTMNASDAATVLVYDGPSDSRPFIDIQGPISGVHLEGFMLDCNGKNVVPIRSMRSFHQTVRQVTCVNWRNNFMLEIGADSALGPTYGGAAPIDHYYEQLVGQYPGVGAHGVDIANGNGNVNQITFLRCYIDRYNDVNTIGVRLGYCDHIQFIACHVAQTGASGSGGISYMVRSQPGHTNFPVNIEVIGGSQAGGVTYDNTLATWDGGPYAAIIFDTYKTADGAPVPPKTANGGVDAPHFMFRGITDNGIRFGFGAIASAQQVAAASVISPQAEYIQLTGSATISTINPPHQAFSAPNGIFRMTIIPTSVGPLSLTTGGNIAESYSMTNLRAFDLVYSEGTGFWSRVGG